MDYKKIIKSRKTRFFILKLLNFIPDKPMIKLQYRIKTGRKLNLKNPKRYTEKLQWYKLYYRDNLMKKCVDKFEVRDYIKNKGLENILNPVYGIYERPEEIHFDKLPDKFVMKSTLGSGGNEVIICLDKSLLNKDKAIFKMKSWLNNKNFYGREWVYYENSKPTRIIIEEFLDSNKSEGGLIDYKFFCFNGKVDYLYVIADRDLGKDIGLGIYTKDFVKTENLRGDEKPLKRDIKKPKNYEKMIEYAEILSKDFPHVRVDFYNIEGKIIFGELTFFDGSGYMPFNPDKFDFEMGRNFKIKKGE